MEFALRDLELLYVRSEERNSDHHFFTLNTEVFRCGCAYAGLRSSSSFIVNLRASFEYSSSLILYRIESHTILRNRYQHRYSYAQIAFNNFAEMPSLIEGEDRQTVKRTVPKSANKIHAVAVAKLYIAYPDRSRWTYTGLQGAVVLADDLVGHTFWLKLVDISVRCTQLLQQMSNN